MKKPREYLERISERLDLPRTVMAALPQIDISGFREVSIDMQQGLLAYSDTEIIVAVSLGTVRVCGSRLGIRRMKEGKIIIVGEIENVDLCREVG